MTGKNLEPDLIAAAALGDDILAGRPVYLDDVAPATIAGAYRLLFAYARLVVGDDDEMVRISLRATADLDSIPTTDEEES